MTLQELNKHISEHEQAVAHEAEAVKALHQREVIPQKAALHELHHREGSSSNRPYIGAFYYRTEAAYRIVEAAGPSDVTIRGVDVDDDGKVGAEWTTVGAVTKKGLVADLTCTWPRGKSDELGRIIGAGAIKWPHDALWERLLSWRSPATNFLGKYTDAKHPDGWRLIEAGAAGSTCRVLVRGVDEVGVAEWQAPGTVSEAGDTLTVDFPKKTLKASLTPGAQGNAASLKFADGSSWSRLAAKEFVHDFSRVHDLQAKLTVVLNELIFDAQYADEPVPFDPMRRFIELLEARIEARPPPPTFLHGRVEDAERLQAEADARAVAAEQRAKHVEDKAGMTEAAEARAAEAEARVKGADAKVAEAEERVGEAEARAAAAEERAAAAEGQVAAMEAADAERLAKDADRHSKEVSATLIDTDCPMMSSKAHRSSEHHAEVNVHSLDACVPLVPLALSHPLSPSSRLPSNPDRRRRRQRPRRLRRSRG